MKNTKTLVENKIKEIISEITELKFGCEVELKNGARDIIYRYSNYGNFDVVGHPTTQKESDIKKILGRPITLEDVLRVFGDRIGNDDRIFDLIYGMTYSWQLGKPLSEQSPETIDFLWSILK